MLLGILKLIKMCGLILVFFLIGINNNNGFENVYHQRKRISVYLADRTYALDFK